MQRSWREDEDKCTFIVLDRKTFEESKAETAKEKEIEAMIGDVNLFFIEEDDEGDDDEDVSMKNKINDSIENNQCKEIQNSSNDSVATISSTAPLRVETV